MQNPTMHFGLFVKERILSDSSPSKEEAVSRKLPDRRCAYRPSVTSWLSIKLLSVSLSLSLSPLPPPLTPPCFGMSGRGMMFHGLQPPENLVANLSGGVEDKIIWSRPTCVWPTGIWRKYAGVRVDVRVRANSSAYPDVCAHAYTCSRCVHTLLIPRCMQAYMCACKCLWVSWCACLLACIYVHTSRYYHTQRPCQDMCAILPPPTYTHTHK